MRPVLVLALAVPLLAAPAAAVDGGFGFCPVYTERAYVCIVTWDEPPMICVEWHYGAQYPEWCVRDPRSLLP